jgi:hypothetical protein
MSAVKTLRAVNANHATAPGAPPAFPFSIDKGVKTKRLNAPEILQHAHAILRPITLVQLPQSWAGEPSALEAEVPSVSLGAGPRLVAVLDSAGKAALCLLAVVAVAARAVILLPEKGKAEPAVHSTGCDQCWLDRLFVCRHFSAHGQSTSLAARHAAGHLARSCDYQIPGSRR